MPRRASSGISKGQLTGLALVLLGVVVVGYLLLRIVAGDLVGFDSRARAATELSLSEYLENANSLRGNVYEVTGVIEEQLKWTAENGRLFSLDAKQGTQATPIPIRVPEEFSKINIDRGGEFRFIVEVGKDGLLIAQNIEKI